jgi:oxygen-independent coproporphyrinogen-3 oxidase
VGEGLAALETAQSVFARVSFDLIYALPGQSEAEWEAQLTRALAFGTGHLSLYQLTIEPGTRFAALAAKGELPATDLDHAALLFELTQALTNAAGIPAYEISNHARPGQESRHNLAYWRYQPYAGIGPGAHGRRTGMITRRHKKPENWLAELARTGHGIAEQERIAPADIGIEALLMGLRLTEGIDLTRIAKLADRERAELVDQPAIRRLAGQGLLAAEGDRLRVTPQGMLLLDAILPEIVHT